MDAVDGVGRHVFEHAVGEHHVDAGLVQPTRVVDDEDLGRQIVRCATHGSSTNCAVVVLGKKQGSKAKIADLDVHVLVEEEVAGLEIAMDDVSLMQVLDGATCLDHESTNLGHGEVLALLDRISERAILTQLQNNISTRVEGEGAVELDDIGMG